jgi:hypothetical protein
MEITMDEHYTAIYKRHGSPEYVIYKAGLYQFAPQTEGSNVEAITPTDKFKDMFTNGKVPATLSAAKALNDLVIAAVCDRSGLLDGKAMSAKALDSLSAEGLTESGRTALGSAISRALLEMGRTNSRGMC